MDLKLVLVKGLMQPGRTRKRALLGVLLSFFLLGGGGPVAGQTIIPLIQFNKEWRYEASGLDLGSAWRTNDYDDSAWPIGPGLLQWGESTVYPAPFYTELPYVPTRVTSYFRTRFEMPAQHLVPGLQLFATNLVGADKPFPD